MKFSVYDNAGDELSLIREGDEVTLIASEDSRDVTLVFDEEGFKQLCRAVGYVWSERDNGA